MGYFAEDDKPVYLYKIDKNNELECRKGHFMSYIGCFRDDDETKKYNHYTCADEEGAVYGASVWFYEPNERKAATILSMHYEREIEKLQSRIDGLIDKLEALDSILQEEN